MADWRKTAKAILLADGCIDAREVAVLRRELFADGTLDEIEMEFLFELRGAAQKVTTSFNFLMIDALKACLLKDGTLNAHAASLLRRWIFADGKADFGEKRFLQELRAAARSVSKEFDALYIQAGANS